ncbi:YtxH domain-containing protein [Aneurinibacillus aneurinilyticus]|uniref:YtxH domain-containing protein n=2 Tax=Aneurinibacillus aneurinilyticus TaxID=1391 RepID=UPI0035234F13
MSNNTSNTSANSYNRCEDASVERVERTGMAEDARSTDWAQAEKRTVKKSMNKLIWGTVAGGVLGATAIILADKTTREDVFRSTAKAKDKTIEFMSSNRVMEIVEDAKESMRNATSETSDEGRNCIHYDN